MISPPDRVIRVATETASISPCSKSKRGAVIFFDDSGIVDIVGAAFNSPPDGIACLGTAACRDACSKRCVHAEARAVRNAMRPAPSNIAKATRVIILPVVEVPFSVMELVHIKVEGGRAVAGGPPSCWQCSREILDAGIGFVWLWEIDQLGEQGDTTNWHRYTAAEFHAETMMNCGLV